MLSEISGQIPKRISEGALEANICISNHGAVSKAFHERFEKKC